MNIYRNLWIVVGLCIALAFPYTASAHKHIDFYVTYKEGDETLVFQCHGPWLRISPLDQAKAGADHVKFYSAVVNIFSPYGKWDCTSCEKSIDPTFDCMGELRKTTFHLKKDDDEVNLTLTEDSIHVDLEDGDTVTASAALGDNHRRPRRDRDTFTFHFGPNPGDGAVRITLEEDPETGHTGEEAVLILQNGDTQIEHISGVLPLEITADLDIDNEYRLIVQHRGIPTDLRFRGNYLLSIKSDSGLVEEIMPTPDVEQ